MAKLSGESTAEIEAPINTVWGLVQDVERAPQWQDGLERVDALERDQHGRATRCLTVTDAKVRRVKATVRFTYEPPRRLLFTQEDGDLASVVGHWELEDLGGGRTRVTYRIAVELGRMLGLVVRGPIVDVLRQLLAGARAGELKRALEHG